MIKEISQAFLDALMSVEALLLDAAERFVPSISCNCGGKLVRDGKTAVCNKCNRKFDAEDK